MQCHHLPIGRLVRGASVTTSLDGGDPEIPQYPQPPVPSVFANAVPFLGEIEREPHRTSGAALAGRTHLHVDEQRCESRAGQRDDPTPRPQLDRHSDVQIIESPPTGVPRRLIRCRVRLATSALVQRSENEWSPRFVLNDFNELMVNEGVYGRPNLTRRAYAGDLRVRRCAKRDCVGRRDRAPQEGEIDAKTNVPPAAAPDEMGQRRWLEVLVAGNERVANWNRVSLEATGNGQCGITLVLVGDRFGRLPSSHGLPQQTVRRAVLVVHFLPLRVYQTIAAGYALLSSAEFAVDTLLLSLDQVRRLAIVDQVKPAEFGADRRQVWYAEGNEASAAKGLVTAWSSGPIGHVHAEETWGNVTRRTGTTASMWVRIPPAALAWPVAYGPPVHLDADLILYYDAEARGRHRVSHGDLRIGLRQRFAARLRATGRLKLIDVGSGPGLDTEEWQRDGFTVVGLDLAAANVELMHQRGLNAVTGSLYQLPFRTGAFEALWTMSTFVHVPDERFDEAITEMIRVVRPGAPLGIGTWGGQDFEGVPEFGELRPYRFFSLASHERWREMLSRHGQLDVFETYESASTDGWEYQFAILRAPG